MSLSQPLQHILASHRSTRVLRVLCVGASPHTIYTSLDNRGSFIYVPKNPHAETPLSMYHTSRCVRYNCQCGLSNNLAPWYCDTTYSSVIDMSNHTHGWRFPCAATFLNSGGIYRWQLRTGIDGHDCWKFHSRRGWNFCTPSSQISEFLIQIIMFIL
jgi:hypothetical protein